MGKVIPLPTKKLIPPKSETFEHAGQRYTCTYDPNAPPDKRWVWKVDYVCTFTYFGSSPSMENAAKAARLKIHKLVKRDVDWEETHA